MARKGFAVTKEPTIVGRPQKPTDMAVPAVSYAAKATVAGARPRAYPTVYIASGAAVPARRVDGKVVHVPYTELLKADGTPINGNGVVPSEVVEDKAVEGGPDPVVARAVALLTEHAAKAA